MAIDWRRTSVRVGPAGRTRCEPGWRLARAWSQRLRDFDLWFVWAGAGTMQLRGGERVDLRPGVCFWMRPGGLYLGEQDEHNRLGVTFIHFDLLDEHGGVRSADAPLPDEVIELPDVGYADMVGRHVVELVRLERSGGAALGPRTSAIAQTLMTGLLMEVDAWSDLRRAGLKRGTSAHHAEQMMAAAARIADDPAAAPSVAQLARSAGYSADHFTRLFKQVLGQTPQSYAINVRLDRARQLLLESSLSVSQIADALGYPDPFTFSAQFKRRLGVSPSAYRQRAS